MKEIQLTRKELFDLVWSESMLSLSKKFDISDVGLRKICKMMNIRTPKMGHWMKVKYSKPSTIPVLTEDDQLKLDTVVMLKEKSEITTKESNDNLSILEKEIIKDPNLSLKVPSRLVNPDKMILLAQAHFNSYHSRTMPGRRLTISRDILDIAVASENIGRALRFMDTLIKALKARGHTIEANVFSTSVVVKGEKIQIKLREKYKRVEKPNPKYDWDRFDYLPTGLFYFTMKADLDEIKFKDGKKPIEELLSRILANLELSGIELKKKMMEYLRRKEEEKERERIRKEYEKRKEQELCDFKVLLKKSQRWDKAETLRRFIEASMSRFQEKGVCSDELKSWYEWAIRKADWYDPFIEAEDELMQGIDRDKIEQQEENTRSRLFW